MAARANSESSAARNGFPHRAEDALAANSKAEDEIGGCLTGLTCVQGRPALGYAAVIDIPDDRDQNMTAWVVALGRRVPEVTVELYERWLIDESRARVPVARQPMGEHWLEDWLRAADAAISRAATGPSAQELLLQDLNFKGTPLLSGVP